MRRSLRDAQRNCARLKNSRFWMLVCAAFLTGCDTSQKDWLVCDGMPLGQSSDIMHGTISGTDQNGYRFWMPLARFQVCKNIPTAELHPEIAARWKGWEPSL